MQDNLSSDNPINPKLRMVEPQWVNYQGQPYLHLRDPLQLAKDSVLIPQHIAPLLILLDGTRDISGIQSSYLLRTGVRLQETDVREILGQLDDAFLLENEAYQQAAAKALQNYREAPNRTPYHAGLVYPANAEELSKTFAGYGEKFPQENGSDAPDEPLVGMVCPHIDYARGHETYAELWQRAAPSLADVELAIILGTDHSGGMGMLTPTRQNYATPLGTMSTDTEIVDGLADVLGQDRAYSEELHHIKEHSIELASAWFQHYLGERSCPVVPILCGSFHHFVTGDDHPDDDEGIMSAMEYLREATKGRKTLVIAAGDLAHMGPAFGDAQPLDTIARAKLTAEDGESLADICRGDADAFFQRSKKESDYRRICGLSPIYLALKYLGSNVKGESLGYDQCPADEQNGSVVSIAGALLYSSA